MENEHHWNYRVIKHTEESPIEESGYVWFAIHSVYYMNGVPKLVSTEPSKLFGEKEEDLKYDFDLMKKAFDKPHLNYEDF